MVEFLQTCQKPAVQVYQDYIAIYGILVMFSMCALSSQFPINPLPKMPMEYLMKDQTTIVPETSVSDEK